VYVQSPGDCSDTVDFTIGVNNDLQADTLITQDESCYGSADGSFTAVISGGTNPIFYELDNVSIPGPQSQGLASGTYVFEVTSGSCHYAEAFVINSPDALVLNVQTTVEILGNDGTATISVNGGTPGYVFLVNGEVQLNGYFDQLQAGTYTAYIADQNGCADSISFTIQSVVGLTEGKASALNVFPNPANDQLAIQGIEGTYELIVEDLFGKHCLVLQGENDAPVSVAGLPAGIYQLTICQNGQSYSGMKLVKR
jgi:large repetitive protein